MISWRAPGRAGGSGSLPGAGRCGHSEWSSAAPSAVPSASGPADRQGAKTG